MVERPRAHRERYSARAPAHEVIHQSFSFSDWSAILAAKEKEHEELREELGAIRRATRLNQPFGAPEFVKTLESKHARRLNRRPPGRPAKPKASAA